MLIGDECKQCDNNGEGGGVFVLQPQDERSDRCAGYGDSAGAVFGVVDGGGFFAGLEALVLARGGREGSVLHNARIITAVGLRGTVSYFGGGNVGLMVLRSSTGFFMCHWG